MSDITNCTECARAYEAGSEETAHEPDRLCFACRRNAHNEDAKYRPA